MTLDWSSAASSDEFLGIGHLRLRNDSELSPWDWLHRIEIPLFYEPGGSFLGWIANGRLFVSTDRGRGTSSDPPLAGLVETAYERASIPVLESRGDGWLEIRPGPDPDGAWVHICHLPRSIEFERWGGLLLRDDISPLFFRTEVPHALREGPGVEYPRITWIPSRSGMYDLEPLEIVGHWMRVRLEIPSDYCAGPEGESPRVWEGWVRWWGPDLGPWLWFFTRGC